MKYRKIKSVVCIVFGFVLMLVGSGGLVESRKAMLNHHYNSLLPVGWWAILYAILILLGWLVFIYGRKIGQTNAEFILRSKGKMPVLYLRPFEFDTDPSYTINISGMLNGVTTTEIELKAASRKVGPLIAIGNPADGLPTLGAHRTYVGSGNWKETFNQLLEASQLVIITIGTTPGVIWELQQLFSLDNLSKIILHIPYKNDKKSTRQEKWQGFLQKIILGIRNAPRLPENIGNSSFIYFDSEQKALLHARDRSLANNAIVKAIMNKPDDYYVAFYDLRSLLRNMGRLKYSEVLETVAIAVPLIFIIGCLFWLLYMLIS